MQRRQRGEAARSGDWLNPAEVRRSAGRFLLFTAVPYVVFYGMIAIFAATGSGGGGGRIAIAMLAMAGFLYALPHMVFRGATAWILALAINIAIAGAATMAARKKTLSRAWGIYLVLVAAAAVVVHGLRAAFGDPYGLFPHGGI